MVRVLVFFCFILCGLAVHASASELIIGQEALQTLMVGSLFSDHGRWDLLRGGCFAYLERPHIALAAGRVIIDVLQSATGGSLPHSVDLDLLPLPQPTSLPGKGIQVTATSLAVANVVTLASSVDVTFDIKLSAR